MFSTFEIVIFAFIGFVSVYAIIDRVCKCIEKKIISKTYKELMEKGVDVNKASDDIDK